MINQTLTLKAPIKIIPSKNYYLVIQDADGIKHYFHEEHTDKDGTFREGQYDGWEVTVPETGEVSKKAREKMKEVSMCWKGEEKLQCDICTHTWTAVFLEPTLKIRCPNCENMVEYEVITEEDS